MKKILLPALFLLTSFSCFAQSKLEEVTLKNGATVILYSNGFWTYKEEPVKNPVVAGTQRAVTQLSSFQLTPGDTPVLFIENGEKVNILSRYNSEYWKVSYKGRIGYVRDVFFRGTSTAASPATSTPNPAYTAPAPTYTNPAPARTITSSICGARTKTTGRPCQRLVSGGGYCYQHR